MRLIKLALCTLSLLASFAANAFTISNSNGGDGFVSGSFPNFTIVGSDNGSDSNFTSYSDTFGTGGQMSFSWNYGSFDEPGWDSAGYFVNDIFTQLASSAASGNLNVALSADDLFGWYVYTIDGIFGAGVLEVSAQFTPTQAVPEPASIALLGFGLAGLAFARRRKQQ